MLRILMKFGRLVLGHINGQFIDRDRQMFYGLVSNNNRLFRHTNLLRLLPGHCAGRASIRHSVRRHTIGELRYNRPSSIVTPNECPCKREVIAERGSEQMAWQPLTALSRRALTLPFLGLLRQSEVQGIEVALLFRRILCKKADEKKKKKKKKKGALWLL